MKIVLLTQDDPFYLAENIDFLLSKLPPEHEIVSCVLFDVSPFGKKISIFEQAKDTFDVFGAKFFLYFSWQYFINKLNKNKSLKFVLSKYGIPVIKLEKGVNDITSIEKIKSYHPDLLLSIGGNQIFKKPIIELADKGCINLHTALLPLYRGLMPSFWVLKNNEKETGVSVFFVDEGIDSGPIIIQKRVEIGNKTQNELIKETKKLGMEAIIEAINKIERGNLDLIPNPKEQMSYFSKPTRQDVIEFYKNGKRFF